ncbi:MULTISPECIES: ABC-F family ATP-binding cassette domain-containing protein [Pontibacillus]|uniref:ABC-F family ATP-binding cassette domain-containing protein n=1 Tax=Pontibacillus chungwhensis TaxID=265426 RepID=A0ABY8V2A1_9BACI|nr:MULTISPECIES: ABC-F family ATP-binding cassette domain-containing protein [Pontibacillus]MCD5325757.1 ABC-F family ATP-binding cassette domain-containing protein [Pontibacillus sp. HN14]WIF98006.1 ABC-F family ATP-binding cassette domain-containing protein [Pontibacillus chungwhensis]
MSILSVENLYKTYGEKELFNEISFTIAERERIGLIGVNGTGKSTLLKVLAGVDSAEKGTMDHANDFHIEYLPQEPQLEADLSVLEQIYYGDSTIMKTMRQYEQALRVLEEDPTNEKKQERLYQAQQKMDEHDAWEANTVAKTILTKLGIRNFDHPVRSLSGGQKKRVAIAKALIQPADLLILDEPTNHLDNETIEWMESFLSQYKGSLLVVTHDRYFLNRVTNRIYELDKGNLYIYDGNYEVFLEKKAEREELERANEQKRQNTLRRELEWLRRGPKARGTKQKARKDRAEALRDQKVDKSDGEVDIAIGSTRLGNDVFELEGVTKSYEGQTVVDDFNYLVVPGERLGIIGPNGSGKTTLLNMIAGKIEPDEGEISTGQTVKVGYYTQDHQEMDETLRVVEYIKEEAEVVHTIEGDTITAEQMLERFMFPRYMQWTYISKLSGGERRRLYLLRVLMQEPNVLLLDEPTNDLDTQTLTILEEYLDAFPGVVITVSHDRYFLDRVVDHLIAFEDSRIRRFQGNYTEYLEVRKEEEGEALAAERQKAKEEKKASPHKRQKRRKLSYHEQQEWNTIEDRIEQLELRYEEVQSEITATGSDAVRAQELMDEMQQLEEQLEQAMERWEELSTIIEESKQ